MIRTLKYILGIYISFLFIGVLMSVFRSFIYDIDFNLSEDVFILPIKESVKAALICRAIEIFLVKIKR